MTRKFSFFYALLAVSFIFLFVGYKLKSAEKDKISCTLNTQVYLKDYKLDLIIKYDIREGEGRSLLNGVFYKNNINKGNINRIVSFTSSSDGNFYHFENSRVSLTKSDSVDNNELSNILQIFFIQDGTYLDVEFEKQAKDIYTIATGNIKIGVCIGSK
ncbi:hypothetical protein [Enterobacter cancerogenus]|uniref:hypothetical protein n=1 Tax=Enterobacter cancerogenus TaxID=69218 RepID=UPI0007340EF4|nr:hypothetical protein [Enterobacter cancerogenus]KTQ46839.1 hypothetical protein NS104_14180 [Enterobacter cancerogenus]KTQ49125.1 hypothetical protein NS111_18485 [Enterobacter cancerogenus]KTQ69253.1 hypothetical protein NS188_20315 [Enterobacter cancerogenus]KTQ75974.1 hypothetical protein NS31R_23060 [Enterobacter cancerogenus]